MRIGVESSHGFGDCLFNLPLIKALSERSNAKIDVAVRPHCADAFKNIPWVGEVVTIPGLNHGRSALRKLGCTETHQVTQNVKFLEFSSADPQHSLVDTPLYVGRQLGLPDFDQRPIFLPTAAELTVGARYDDGLPNIAIESVFTSAQSWAGKAAFDLIVDAYKDSHRICWLSNSGAPQTRYMDDMLRWTRREAITALQHCQTMFSVGSGFFCSALALPKHRQPKRIVCMWIDNVYRYERRIDALQWHDNLVWVHNLQELEAAL